MKLTLAASILATAVIQAKEQELSAYGKPGKKKLYHDNFNIKIVNMGTNTDFDHLFEAAKRRWEAIITRDLTDIPGIYEVDWFRGQFSQPYVGDVDDVVIGFEIKPIDGPGKILGFSSPYFSRQSDGTTISGGVRFDQDDIESGRFTENDWQVIVLHEIGHVLGITGTLPGHRLRCQPNCVADGIDYTYNCKNAKREYDALNLGFGDLMLNDIGIPASQCSHWSDASFGPFTDLMTPFYVPGMQPISTVTVGCLEDVGYAVDYDQADDILNIDNGYVGPGNNPVYRTDTEFSIGDAMLEFSFGV